MRIINQIRPSGQFQNIKEMDFHRPVTVLFGKNGVGKSQLLHSINQSITGTQDPFVEFDIDPKFSILKLPNTIGNSSDSALSADPAINLVKSLVKSAQFKKKKSYFSDTIFLDKIEELKEKSNLPNLEVLAKIDDADDLTDFFINIPSENKEVSSIQDVFITHWQKAVNLTLKTKNISFEDALDKLKPHPWDRINEMLRSLNLEYSITTPLDLSPSDSFKLQLSNKEGALIPFNLLSSGEKSILAISILEYLTDKSELKPDLILLDEPDAHLHPELISVLMDVVIPKLTQEKNSCKVIMTTHNPITVSLAPDESIYELVREDNEHSIVSRTKSYASKKLLAPLNKIAVVSGDTKTVFTEGKFDKVYYESLFSRLLSDDEFSEKVEFNLDFVPTHVGTGSGSCTDVIHFVNSLKKRNDLVAGIIDLDENSAEIESNSIFVHKNRYSIENFIFDPLVLGAACLGLNNNYFKEEIPDLDIGYPNELYSKPDRILQRVINAFIKKYFSEDLIHSDPRVSPRILNSIQVNIPYYFMSAPGHNLSKDLASKFHEFGSPLKKYISGNDLDKERFFKDSIKFWKLFPAETLELFLKIGKANSYTFF